MDDLEKTPRCLYCPRYPERLLGSNPSDPVRMQVGYKTATNIVHLCRQSRRAEVHWEMLDLSPAQVEKLTPECLKDPWVTDGLIRAPVAALFALTKSYRNTELFQLLLLRLEGALSTDAAVLTKFLDFIHETGVDVDEQRFRRLLVRHPLQGLRWAAARRDREFGVEVLKWAGENRANSAAAAWVQISSEHSADPVPFKRLVVNDPLYAAAFAARFNMQYSVDEFPEDTSGREIFMLLRNNAIHPDEVAAAEMKMLSRDLVWFSEWVLHCGFAKCQEYAAQVVRMATDASHVRHPLSSHLVRVLTDVGNDQWMRHKLRSNTGDDSGDSSSYDVHRSDEAEENGEHGPDR